jgi:dihydroneopterin triphosphate diphosphatase
MKAGEEAGIPPGASFLSLDTINSVPATELPRHVADWSGTVRIVPEHCFGVRFEKKQIRLSAEHPEFRWMRPGMAEAILRFDSNRTAARELGKWLESMCDHYD